MSSLKKTLLANQIYKPFAKYLQTHAENFIAFEGLQRNFVDGNNIKQDILAL